MQENKKKKIINYIVLSIVTLIFILAIIYLAPIMKDISTKEGQLAFKEKINNLGILGFLILFGLEIAQIFFVVIPGEPLEILAGMCYGSIGGTIFITTSVFITTTIIFFTVNVEVSKLFLIQGVWMLFLSLLHYGVVFIIQKQIFRVTR